MYEATSNKQQATSNKQQATSNKQQATSNKQQATSNKRRIVVCASVVVGILILAGISCWLFLLSKTYDSETENPEVVQSEDNKEEVEQNEEIDDGGGKEEKQLIMQPASQPVWKTMDAQTIAALKNEKYYISGYHDRYLKYYSTHSDWSLKKIVTYVNASRDMTRYVDVRNADLSKGVLTLVGKYDYLGQYEPGDLVQLSSTYTSGSTPYLRKEAAEQFMKMADAARREGLVLKNVSGYRSYATQASLYRRYVAQDGVALADTYSSKAGYSEHQLGLATDINSVSDSFAYTKEYQWLQAHAADYGFIMRYPYGLEDITGFTYEPWHYRYVGVAAARQIVVEGITFDEYYAYYIGK